MKKIITPPQVVYPEVTEPKITPKWEEEAIESLQSLERYTVLKAIEEGKRLVKSVMATAAADAGKNSITKFHVQNAIASVLETIEKARHQPGNDKQS